MAEILETASLEDKIEKDKIYSLIYLKFNLSN